MQELGNVIFIDIIIAFLVMGTYMYRGYHNLPNGVDGEHFYFGYNEEQKTCEYLVDASDGKTRRRLPTVSLKGSGRFRIRKETGRLKQFIG